MNPQQQFQLAIINLVTEVGLDTAILILGNLKLVATLDDAVAALQAAQALTAEKILAEEKAKLQPPPAPPAA